MTHNIYIYLGIMAVVTYAIRVLPLTLIRKQIKNQFFQSFLYYVPYVTLAVMTFPAILDATQSPISGVLAIIAGIIVAWFGAGLFSVSLSCCAIVFISEFLLFPV
ncbi:MAG: AzlD domain-containing protein [Eubacteriales bacterium]